MMFHTEHEKTEQRNKNIATKTKRKAASFEKASFQDGVAASERISMYVTRALAKGRLKRETF